MKLKPCPFCGSAGVVATKQEGYFKGNRLYADNYFFVNCCGCDTISPWCETKEEAIVAWNHRVKGAKE